MIRESSEVISKMVLSFQEAHENHTELEISLNELESKLGSPFVKICSDVLKNSSDNGKAFSGLLEDVLKEGKGVNWIVDNVRDLEIARKEVEELKKELSNFSTEVTDLVNQGKTLSFFMYY
jgi:hypothetical protein